MSTLCLHVATDSAVVSLTHSSSHYIVEIIPGILTLLLYDLRWISCGVIEKRIGLVLFFRLE